MQSPRTVRRLPKTTMIRTPHIAPLLLAIIGVLAISCQSAPLTTAPDAAWKTTYASLLAEFAEESGVNYAGWKKDEAKLKQLEGVLASIAETKVDKLSKDEKLAFYINAYNAWILRRLLETYPNKGPLAVNPLFFKLNSIRVAGTDMSFDHLEQTIIRKEFQEPRIHFALNCGSVSCPPLSPKIFQATTLDKHLEELTIDFINENPHALDVSKDGAEAKISELFKWYEVDFQPSVIAYLNKYRKEKLPDGIKISYLTYDWNLNERTP